jgi:hypothetical protein
VAVVVVVVVVVVTVVVCGGGTFLHIYFTFYSHFHKHLSVLCAAYRTLTVLFALKQPYSLIEFIQQKVYD